MIGKRFLREERAALAVTAAFVVSRLAYRLVQGVRFDASPMHYFLHFIDPWFVDHDFLRSLLYLHHQAPLPNLVAGSAWRLFGPQGATVFLDGLFLTLGVTLALALLYVLRASGVGEVLATVLVTLYVVSPVTVVYESLLFYHLPVAALLVLGLAALLHYYRQGTSGAAFVFFSVLAVVALTRSIFGLLWMVTAALGVLLLPAPSPEPGRSPRVRVLRGAALPLLLVLLVSAKTRWLIGHEYGGALFWPNLAVKVFEHVPPEERQRLLEQGILTKAVTVNPFSDLSEYAQVRVSHPPTGIPLLDMERLPNGRANAHALEYALIAEQHYRPDALYLVRHYPRAYLESVWVAFRDWYFLSSSQDATIEQERNFRLLRRSEEALRRGSGRLANGSLLLLVIALPLAVLYGLGRLALLVRARVRNPALIAALVYVLVTISYATVAPALVSYGDFNRYRFDVDPLYLFLTALLLQDALARFPRRA